MKLAISMRTRTYIEQKLILIPKKGVISLTASRVGRVSRELHRRALQRRLFAEGENTGSERIASGDKEKRRRKGKSAV